MHREQLVPLARRGHPGLLPDDAVRHRAVAAGRTRTSRGAPPTDADGPAAPGVVPLQLRALRSDASSCWATYLRYCRPGDEAWSQVQAQVCFDGAVACHRGKVYATTYGNHAVVVDASSSPALRDGKIYDVTIPGPFPGNLPRCQYLVPTTSPDGGDLYFVRANFFGYPAEVVGVEVCRWDPSEDAWREVDGIGDTTFFVGRNCVAVSPATEAGTEPNCVHILKSGYDGVWVYTFSLHGRTIRCDFVGVGEEGEEEDDDEEDTNPPPETTAYWSVPSNDPG